MTAYRERPRHLVLSWMAALSSAVGLNIIAQQYLGELMGAVVEMPSLPQA